MEQTKHFERWDEFYIFAERMSLKKSGCMKYLRLHRLISNGKNKIK